MSVFRSPFTQSQATFSNDPQFLQDWLVDRLAEYLDVAPSAIDVRQSIADYGLGSMSAVKFSGEVEKFTGKQISPTLIWDYPTIEKIVAHLTEPESSTRIRA